jgi:ribosomal-protein-alanine N-acetyltransferase
VKIRKATVDDVSFLIEIGRESSSAHWSERQYRELFAGTSGRLVLVAEAEEETKGAPANGPSRGSDEHDALYRHVGGLGFLVARDITPEWELENIVVAPPARRTGLGTKLLKALLDTVRDTNDGAVFLEVRESNSAARGLYEKLGFRETGRRKSYYVNPLEDAILYRWDRPKSFS